jgi:hypothetical protein
MSVTTTIYAVGTKMMKKVKADNEKFAFLFGECEEDERWKVESFSFESSVDTYTQIFFNAGAKKSRGLIDSGNNNLDIFDYNGYDIWVVPPSRVKTMTKELEALNPTMEDKIISYSLMEIVNGIIQIDKQEIEVLKITDRRGNPLSSDEIRACLEDITKFKEFLQKAVEQQHYLLFSES